MFQEGLFTFITSNSTFQSIVGTSRGDANKGLFLILARAQATLPYVVYQRLSGSPARSYQGANKFQRSRWRFKCCAIDPEGAVRLAEFLKLLFATYTGTFPDGTVVSNVALESEADDTESLPHGTIFSVHVDFTFMYVDNNGA